MLNDWIIPDWPVPHNVRALSTTRTGGVSTGVYASFNLGAHVGDDSAAVVENRRRLRETLGLPHEPCWLHQVHDARVVRLEGAAITESADAAVSSKAGEACVVMTADCLPVLLCDAAGKTVAAAHAGWRGISAGVLEATVAAMQIEPGEILAWLGPAIGPQTYEVGEDVRAALAQDRPEAEQAFEPSRSGKWFCDLYALARLRLRSVGVRHIYGGGFCTLTESRRFFSYRRDGECGRMATLIWLEG